MANQANARRGRRWVRLLPAVGLAFALATGVGLGDPATAHPSAPATPSIDTMQRAMDVIQFLDDEANLLRRGNSNLPGDDRVSIRRKTVTLGLKAWAALLAVGVPPKPEPPPGFAMYTPIGIGATAAEAAADARAKIEAERKRRDAALLASRRWYMEIEILEYEKDMALDVSIPYESPPYATQELREMAAEILKNDGLVSDLISGVKAKIAEWDPNGRGTEVQGTPVPPDQAPPAQLQELQPVVRGLIEQSFDACLRLVDAPEADRGAARREFALVSLKAMAVLSAAGFSGVPKEVQRPPAFPSLENLQQPTEQDQAALKQYREQYAAWQAACNKSRLASELADYYGLLSRVVCDAYALEPPAVDELRQLATETLKDDAAVGELLAKFEGQVAAQAWERGEEPPVPAAPAPPAPAGPPAQ